MDNLDCPIEIASLLDQLGWKYDHTCGRWILLFPKEHEQKFLKSWRSTWIDAIQEELAISIKQRQILNEKSSGAC